MRILVATPCFGRTLSQSYVSSLVGLISGFEQEEIFYQTLFLGNEANIQRARNDIVHYALSSSEKFTHLLMIDADMGFEWDDFENLRLSGERFISGLCPKKKYPLEYVFRPLMNFARVPQTGPFQVFSSSIAFALCDLNVFREHEKFAKEYTGVSCITQREEKIRNWFPSGPNEDGVFQSEDHGFFSILRAAGEPIFIHMSARVTHTGNHTFGKEVQP